MHNEDQQTVFQREIRDYWHVKFNERGLPHVQQAFVLPPERMKEFDPFIFLAEDWFKKGTFSDHPHRGFQTVTYVIDGRLEHIDNHGGHSIVEAGDVQYMNAGRGARHAEEPVEEDIVHSLQLWLNLPKNLKTTEPFYQNIYCNKVPRISFTGGEVKVYSGQLEEVKGPLEALVPFVLWEISLEEGASYMLSLPESYNGFVYVLSGDLDAGKNKINLTKTSVGALSFKGDGQASQLSELYIKANTRSKLLLYAGEPIGEEVVAQGPFVMNTVEEIQQAYQDYRQGKFGPAVKSPMST